MKISQGPVTPASRFSPRLTPASRITPVSLGRKLKHQTSYSSDDIMRDIEQAHDRLVYVITKIADKRKGTLDEMKESVKELIDIELTSIKRIATDINDCVKEGPGKKPGGPRDEPGGPRDEPGVRDEPGGPRDEPGGPRGQGVPGVLGEKLGGRGVFVEGDEIDFDSFDQK